IGSDAVLVGTIDVPAGLAPGASTSFDQELALPPSAIPNLGTNPSYYLTLKIDPDQKVTESDTTNNQGQGQGGDTSVVPITPRQPANLVGGSFIVTPDFANWGDLVTITARVTNTGAGDAPATRALVVLSPSDKMPGGDSDVMVGSLAIPAIPSQQSADIQQVLKLPSAPPASANGNTQYVLTMFRDADHVTGPSPAAPRGLLGADEAQILVNTNPNTPVPTQPAPQSDLSVATTQGPSQTITWAQPFQVAETVQNTGPSDAGPFKVRFTLEGDVTPADPTPLA